MVHGYYYEQGKTQTGRREGSAMGLMPSEHSQWVWCWSTVPHSRAVTSHVPVLTGIALQWCALPGLSVCLTIAKESLDSRFHREGPAGSEEPPFVSFLCVGLSHRH